MDSVKIKRLELLDIVRENKLKHVAAYEDSVNEYKKLVLQIASSNYKIAKTGDLESFKKIKAHPVSPVSYEDSYLRAIRMLELSVEDVIELSSDLFNQLVLDEWSWKRNFIASTMSYKSHGL